MTREELIAWATANGWQEDRFGHLQKKNEDPIRCYRLKLSRIAARYEVRSGSGWVRLRSGYFKDLSIVDGKLSGMKY